MISRLAKERKAALIEPSDDIKDSYIKKSESNLISAKILFKNGRLEESVSLAYYSMYHMASALLFKAGIKCENHTASIWMLKELFGIDNGSILFAKSERIDKQYYTDFDITRKEVSESIDSAEEFNKMMFDLISRLSNKKVEESRKEYLRMICE